MQRATSRLIHERNRDQRHHNLHNGEIKIVTVLAQQPKLRRELTMMQPIPIVANFALSSVKPELMKSEVE